MELTGVSRLLIDRGLSQLNDYLRKNDSVTSLTIMQINKWLKDNKFPYEIEINYESRIIIKLL